MSNIPVLILREGTKEKGADEARKNNINAMLAVVDAVKSTLGPKGMSKMIVDSLGDSTITSDGAEILDQLDIEHVAAVMMVNLAKAIDKEVGDGTTSAVIFTGKLLENALELAEQQLHPKNIIKGYRLASQKAIELLKEIAQEVPAPDDTILKNAARTAMNAKDISIYEDHFSEIALNAVKQIAEKTTYDKIDNIKIVKSPGKSQADSELITGLYVQKDKVNSAMPDELKDVKIAVIRRKLDVSKTEYTANIQISKAEDIQKFKDSEDKILTDYLKIFKDLGINMIVNNQDISDKFAGYLAREGIAAIKNLGESDIKAVLSATGAKRIDDLKALTEEDLGHAQEVFFEKVNKDTYTVFKGCPNPKSVTILVKGGLDKILDSAELALKDVFCVLAKILDTKKIVAGGGATYMELSKRLKDYANQIKGKEQLAAQAYALALEEIPRVLIENAGLSEIELMTELRAAHKSEADKWMGIDTLDGTIGNNFDKGIIEPAAILEHILKSGTELANIILRVDRIINSQGSELPGMDGAGPPDDYY